MEDGPAGPEFGVQPAVACVAVVAARALGDELADLGCEGQRRIELLGSIELLLQLVGSEPQAGVPPGLVVGYQAVVDETGDADGALGMALLPAGELQSAPRSSPGAQRRDMRDNTP